MKNTIVLVLTFMAIAFFVSSCNEANEEECIQCEVKNRQGTVLLLDNEQCGSEQELAVYKVNLADSNKIHCGLIKVMDTNFGGQTVYSEDICNRQSVVDAAVVSANANHGCGTCNTYFFEDSVIAAVLDCKAK